MSAQWKAVGLAIGLFAVALPATAAPSRSKAAARPTVAALLLSPASLHLSGKGTIEPVSVTAQLSNGARKDVTATAALTASTRAVRPLPGARLQAVSDGRATVTVSYGGRRARLPVTVSGAARPRAVSFQWDVLPILTRAGCNQGTCHGNAEGRGGFKISLRGEAPEADYAIIARQGGGRRIDRVDPGRSLLLLKATSTLPHGGGRRFGPDSDEYRTVAGWIAEGAKLDGPEAPKLVRLEVTPKEQVLFEPARMQRLTVRGYFSDGSVRNLARKSIYNAGDPLVEVTDDGNVLFDRSADVAVLVRYADRMENARLTYVPARKAFAWKPVPPNNWVDELAFKRLKLLRLEPSAPTTDSEFVHRAYVDAIGLLPKPEEAREFLASTDANKREKLIDSLLRRPEFDDYWTMKWADILRLEERTLDPKGSMAYREWIRTAISTGMPLDRFAYELLTATGSTYTDPPANYYRRTRTAIELAENTAQTFMGVRMLCAKCHNHPFERWKQDDYYTLAAFFARVGRKGEFTRKDRFDLHELIGEETISVADKGEVENPRTDRPAAPRIYAPGVPGSETPPVGPSQDPRVVFAEWLTRPDNPYFAKAMVNRIWYHLMGKGLVDPVDDLRESNPASHPELLEALAKDFRAHGCDLRHVVRTIMTSRIYQLSSSPNRTNADDDRFFSRAIPTRLGAEVLLDAISQLTEVEERFPGMPAGTRAVHLIPKKQKNPFLKLFGQPMRESVCECERSGETTLGQSFALISGEMVDRKLKVPRNRVGRLIEAGKSDAEITEELYLAAYSRFPTAKERAAMLAYVRGKADRRQALEDCLWALINSKEFLLRR